MFCYLLHLFSNTSVLVALLYLVIEQLHVVSLVVILFYSNLFLYFMFLNNLLFSFASMTNERIVINN